MAHWCSLAEQLYLDAQRIPYGAIDAHSDYCVNSHKGQREMTAEDLGLPCRVEAWASTLMMILIQRQRGLWKEHNKPHAPYAFWLGADA